MLQNTYGNKGLDTLFGPGRIPDFWTPIVKNIHVFVHPIKKPSQAQGFWTYIHASGCLLVRSFRKHNTQLASLSWPKPVCLWWFLHFQARCMYVCMYACTHLEAQKIKFRPGSPECFQTLTETKVWTHFGPSRILDFWPPIVKNIRVFVHQSKNPHRQRDFEHTYTPEGCSATVQNPSACEGFWSVELCMYVCMLEFKTPHRQRVFEHTYINTYIRTYILTFARRINIDFNSSATLRNEIPKRTCLGLDFQQQKQNIFGYWAVWA